ncbi:MAG: response regulator [Gammaproteobacteria bacterium]|nr:response regulator [Gammaproteobacteria bacterium]
MDLIPANTKDSVILVVDDEPANVKLLQKMLAAQGYRNVITTNDPRDALPLYQQHHVDIVLLDLNMPYMSGYEVMHQLKEQLHEDFLTILILTAQNDRDSRLQALQAGARDFITKPFDHQELMTRLQNNLESRSLHLAVRDQNKLLEEKVRKRTKELRDTRLEIIRRLGRAAEYRDNETGLHILRMSNYSALLAKAAGFDERMCELVLQASPMHDIGKIGIPDAILLKPGKLTLEEWTVMKTHPVIGAEILSGHNDDLMVCAREIALNHHEKWDGSGYPAKIAAEQIPLTARIVAVADVFDALTTSRPYKHAWTVDEAVRQINDTSGSHFDPMLVGHFNNVLPELLAIKQRYAEPEPGIERQQSSY